MNNLDELSRAIGRIEGTLSEMKKSHDTLWTKLDRLEKYFTHHRIKVATIAGSVSAAVTMFATFFKGFKN